MSEPSLPARIEAFLFSEGGSLAMRRLAKLLGVKESDLNVALDALEHSLEGRGIALVRTSTEVALALAPASSEEVRKAQAAELGREIGDAGLEVLAIILYRGASTRSQIDYIRGVNTGSTIRNLLARGLLERVGNPEDAREYLYRPTVETLAHLGIRKSEDLPDYGIISGELKSFEEASAFDSHDISTDGTFDAGGPHKGPEEPLS